MIQLAGNVIIEDGKILLLYSKDEEHWEVPGGKVEENESPTHTAVREAKEEIGVNIELERPFYTGEFQHNDQIFEWNGYISSIKEGRPEIQDAVLGNETAYSSNSEKCCGDKFKELKWFSREELEKCEELAPNIRMVESGILRLL
jgi:ADP-ribose pyrophosphatase YjhB (NUDIX family)